MNVFYFVNVECVFLIICMYYYVRNFIFLIYKCSMLLIYLHLLTILVSIPVSYPSESNGRNHSGMHEGCPVCLYIGKLPLSGGAARVVGQGAVPH